MRTRFLYTLSLGLAVSTMAMTAMLAPVDGAYAQKKKKNKKAKKQKEELSEEFLAPYNAAVTALEAKDAATLEAQLGQAAALAKSSDEKFRLGNAYIQLGGMKSDTNIQRKGLDLMLDSGRVAPEQYARFSFLSGNFAYSAKEYATAEGRLKQALDAGYYNDNAELLYVDSIYQQGRTAESLQLLENVVTRIQQSGEAVPEDYFRRGLRQAYSAKDVAKTTAWSQKWVAAYPNQQSWRDSLVLFRDGSAFDSKTNVDLMRLMRASNALASERDYAEYIENADPRRLPGEVLSVVEEGIAKGTLESGDEFFSEQLNAAKSRISEDRGSLASGGKASRSSSNPRIAIGTADAYLGYGEYSNAIDLYNVALQKPGVDSDLVNTRIGISNALAGNYDAAKAAFANVGGSRTDLAKFWTIWVENQASASASATPAAQPAT
jgi:tetratricopeptide (TPR) repeat protein